MKITITQEDVTAVLESLQQNFAPLFLIDAARRTIARRRYEEYRRAGDMAMSPEQYGLIDDAIPHNLKALDNWGAVERTNRLARALSVVDRVFYHGAKLKVLSVGPRTEMELLSLVGHGFAPDNIRGLDLFSYSPWIDVGNMHSMPYQDSTYDVVIAGWVLVYSNDPDLACREMLRVAKNGGIIAIGATRLGAKKWQAEANGRSHKHNPNAQDILDMFGANVSRVYVRHDAASDEEEARTIVVFDVKK